MDTTITMLGTGNAMCTRCYNTCFYLRTAGGGLLVDAGGGNGIFRQLYRGKVAFEQIHHLFVTHCHTDHILGVIWLIRKISPMMYKGKYHGTLTIYCHDEVIDAIITMCRLMMPAKIYKAMGNTIIMQASGDRRPDAHRRHAGHVFRHRVDQDETVWLRRAPAQRQARGVPGRRALFQPSSELWAEPTG